jgi:hypothetical protein
MLPKPEETVVSENVKVARGRKMTAPYAGTVTGRIRSLRHETGSGRSGHERARVTFPRSGAYFTKQDR